MMKKDILIKLFLPVAILFDYAAMAQKTMDTLNTYQLPRHSISLMASSIIFYNAADIGYNMLFKTPKNPNRYLGFSVGFGAHYIVVPGFGLSQDEYYIGYYAKSDFILLLGANKKYFEFNLGMIAGKAKQTDKTSGEIDNVIMPNVSLGYRKITSNGKGVFRIGAAFPRGFYIGYGINL